MKSLIERLDEKIATGSGCWEWRAGFDEKGYGRVALDRRSRYAHRVVYELLVGPIPEGMQLDHLCRNPACVNPAHLEPVTQRENILRGVGVAVRHAAQTHCVHGHIFDAANTYERPGGRGRDCKACVVARQRRYLTRRRGSPKIEQ